MTREQAWNLLHEYTKNPNLLKHAYAVETAMVAYAKKFQQDEERWAAIGLLHDFDYDAYPDEHPQKGAEILREKGVEESIIKAVLSHADCTGVPRETLLEKTLFAVDELSGFIAAAALVRPSKSILDLQAKSVMKRMKEKAFARAVSREDLRNGADALNVELKDHIQFVIEALREKADELGLRGVL